MRCVCARGAQHVWLGCNFRFLMRSPWVELGSTPVWHVAGARRRVLGGAWPRSQSVFALAVRLQGAWALRLASLHAWLSFSVPLGASRAGDSSHVLAICQGQRTSRQDVGPRSYGQKVDKKQDFECSLARVVFDYVQTYDKKPNIIVMFL